MMKPIALALLSLIVLGKTDLYAEDLISPMHASMLKYSLESAQTTLNTTLDQLDLFSEGKLKYDFQFRTLAKSDRILLMQLGGLSGRLSTANITGIDRDGKPARIVLDGELFDKIADIVARLQAATVELAHAIQSSNDDIVSVQAIVDSRKYETLKGILDEVEELLTKFSSP